MRPAGQIRRQGGLKQPLRMHRNEQDSIDPKTVEGDSGSVEQRPSWRLLCGAFEAHALDGKQERVAQHCGDALPPAMLQGRCSQNVAWLRYLRGVVRAQRRARHQHHQRAPLQRP